MENNIHLMIIWKEALFLEERILSDLRESFSILRVFDIHWTDELFLDNYTVFYSHSLRTLSPERQKEVLLNKMAHCGVGSFKAIVLIDNAPRYENRQTSSGDSVVNTNVFDKKTLYRIWAGGGSRIHASDNAWETNKDLTILFGLNTHDFLSKYISLSDDQIEYNNNCIGVGGYRDISQLFYVLNNTIRYVVLRNHEPIPEQYTVEGHGDIDLLVESRNYMAYLTLAKKIFPEPYRVYHTIIINGKAVPFDFRYTGDNYYDRAWQEDILNRRVISKNLFYVPNSIDQYYSLLYHVYIQKRSLIPDYIPKLAEYAKQAGAEYSSEVPKAIRILDNYMSKYGYEYIKPEDISVFYNEEHLSQSSYALRYGKCIKSLYVIEDASLQSKVFEKKESFVKIGTPFLIDREYYFLKELSDYTFIPRILSYSKTERVCSLETARISGQDFFSFFSDPRHRTFRYFKTFTIGILRILEAFASCHIIHRDFTPFNLIINDNGKDCDVYVLDFGWASKLPLKNEGPILKGLGNGYYSSENRSDFYAAGKILERHFGQTRMVLRVANALQNICISDYDDLSHLRNKISIVRKNLWLCSPRDIRNELCYQYYSLLNNHPHILGIRLRFSNLFK